MPVRLIKYLAILMLFNSSLFIPFCTNEVKAEMDIQKQKFNEFENEIYDLLKFSIEPFYELDKLQNTVTERDLYNIAVSVEERFTRSISSLSKLGVPNELPDDIKGSLEQVKVDLSIGFTALGQSMNYFTKHLGNDNPEIYNRYMESRNKGFLYVNGGMTYLTTIKLKFDPPEWGNIPEGREPEEEAPGVWEVSKEYFYKLEKAIQVSNSIQPTR